MQPTLNVAEDSKDIMLNALKFPIVQWLYDPANKNNTEQTSKSVCGGRTNWVCIQETERYFQKAISLLAMTESLSDQAKPPVVSQSTKIHCNLLSSTETVYSMNKS